MSLQHPKPVMAKTQMAKTTASSKMHKPRNSKPQFGVTNSKVGATRNALVKSQLRHKAPLTIQNFQSRLAPASMKTDLDLYSANPQPNGKMSVKPTPKLMQAIKNLGPDSKPIQAKLVRRESEGDMDTSSYESDSSGTTLSIGSLLRPYATINNQRFAKDKATDNSLQWDVSSLMQKVNIDLSKIPEKTPSGSLDFPGVPVWFPLKIKRVLKDKGFPDALPFKVSS